MKDRAERLASFFRWFLKKRQEELTIEFYDDLLKEMSDISVPALNVARSGLALVQAGDDGKPEKPAMFKLSEKPTVKEIMPALIKADGEGIKNKVREAVKDRNHPTPPEAQTNRLQQEVFLNQRQLQQFQRQQEFFRQEVPLLQAFGQIGTALGSVGQWSVTTTNTTT